MQKDTERNLSGIIRGLYEYSPDITLLERPSPLSIGQFRQWYDAFFGSRIISDKEFATVLDGNQSDGNRLIATLKRTYVDGHYDGSRNDLSEKDLVRFVEISRKRERWNRVYLNNMLGVMAYPRHDLDLSSAASLYTLLFHENMQRIQLRN